MRAGQNVDPPDAPRAGPRSPTRGYDQTTGFGRQIGDRLGHGRRSLPSAGNPELPDGHAEPPCAQIDLDPSPCPTDVATDQMTRRNGLDTGSVDRFEVGAMAH